MNSDHRPSPGLQMNHGFVRKIEQNQILRGQQAGEDVMKRNETAKLAQRIGMSVKHHKPSMEIYRPPSLRVSGDFGGKWIVPYETFVSTPQTIPEGAVPWFSTQTSSSMINNTPVSVAPTQYQQFIPTKGLSKSRSTTSAHRVHFQDDQMGFIGDGKGDCGASKMESHGYGLKRSKSLGSSDMKLLMSPELEISTFGPDVQSTIRKAIDDPNSLPARQLMELVRHLFNRVLECVRYAEPTARLCIVIIQRETTETFLESLLNSCREWFNERDRLFNEPLSRQAMKPSRWVAYVTFLYELYSRLKSLKQSSLMTGSKACPATLILMLLSECCLLFMKPSSLAGCGEIECLFFVLPSIGRDLRNESPHRMEVLMNAARDAFVAPSTSKSARKTLLQLIEMNASNWQLTASAVAYYYPGHHLRE